MKKEIIALIFTISGLGLLIYVDWKIAIGVALYMAASRISPTN